MEEQNITPEVAKKPGNGLGIASLIISIFGFILSFIPVINVFGMVLAVTSLALGIVGMIMAKKKGGSKTLSLVGVILSALAIIIFIAMYTWFAAAASVS
ncbi:MAG: hypothetical protein WCQ95_10385 [Bacteroidota bacterium]